MFFGLQFLHLDSNYYYYLILFSIIACWEIFLFVNFYFFYHHWFIYFVDFLINVLYFIFIIILIKLSLNFQWFLIYFLFNIFLIYHLSLHRIKDRRILNRLENNYNFYCQNFWFVSQYLRSASFIDVFFIVFVFLGSS